MTKSVFKLALIGVAIAVVLFLGIQLIPVWALKTNPPVIAEPQWDSPDTRALAQRACFDCHSNETVWPWYSNVAPVSWLVIMDTVRGRNKLNFSEWGMREAESGEAGEQIQNGEMPPSTYLITHPEAKLTDAEKQQLIDGLYKSMGAAGEGGNFESGGEGGEQEGGG
ncbi:MAG: cytochrome C [Chloroflexi bacterium]|nr:cytochrome C [Chloroflexota bacterium]